MVHNGRVIGPVQRHGATLAAGVHIGRDLFVHVPEFRRHGGTLAGGDRVEVVPCVVAPEAVKGDGVHDLGGEHLPGVALRLVCKVGDENLHLEGGSGVEVVSLILAVAAEERDGGEAAGFLRATLQ